MIKLPAVAAGLRLRNLMESHAPPLTPPRKDYIPYNHTDACRLSRWTARESYQFMYARQWQMVNDFYLDMVNGRISLSELFGKESTAVDDDGDENVEICDESELAKFPAKDKGGRWARVTFKIVLSYHGDSFDGWQKQPGLNTIQGLVEKSLGKFVDEKKEQLLREKNLPLDGCVTVAGRTDKGVSALKQVCSFYTWRKDVKKQDIEDAINGVSPGKIRITSVSQVSREFHPNFSARWRRYFYIFPLEGGNIVDQASQFNKVFADGEETFECLVDGDEKNDQEMGKKPNSFEVSSVSRLLHQLEGKLLSYSMFARDTKASRNVGPPTECFVFHARAAEAYLPCSKDGTRQKAMFIELVANRFLRRMVRVLVSTSIREAAAGAGEDSLLNLMDASCRRATAPPAPPEGLCLVDVGYTDFDRKCCLIN